MGLQQQSNSEDPIGHRPKFQDHNRYVHPHGSPKNFCIALWLHVRRLGTLGQQCLLGSETKIAKSVCLTFDRTGGGPFTLMNA